MSKKVALESLVVDGVTYVPEGDSKPDGPRVVLVVDRGWIFAGDLTVLGKRLLLSRALLVQRWDGLGFEGMIADPKNSKVILKRITGCVDVPEDSEIFRIPVGAEWGL